MTVGEFFKEYGGPLATVFASIVAAFASIVAVCVTRTLGRGQHEIAKAQWWTAENKLRLDLFDRRYAVFAAAKDFTLIIIQHGDFVDSDLNASARGTADADFLFDEDVSCFLKEIRKNAVDLRLCRQVFEGKAPSSTSREGVVQRFQELGSLFDIEGLNDCFRAYLGFKKLEASS